MIVIIGGGPGGYEAALVARQLGAEVTLIERFGIGGSAVLTDVVPSKALISIADAVIDARNAAIFGLQVDGVHVDLSDVNSRLRQWAISQSDDIRAALQAEGVEIINGTGRLLAADQVEVTLTSGEVRSIPADAVLIATGARPRVLESAVPDGERILSWDQLYALPELPTHLIVVGSGVTGAEFAGAYLALGSEVTLVSSREHVLPSEDADAAAVVESAFAERGMRVLSRSRAVAARRVDDGVVVELADGSAVSGSHVLMAVGSLPNTEDLGLAQVGVETTASGHIVVDRVSRTNVRGIYAAGDCTGVLLLASVAAMQGRIAMAHALGDAVEPLDLSTVASNVFTDPEIATVGVTQGQASDIAQVMVPLMRNPRAKMLGFENGFIKLFCAPGTHLVVGGVVVAPRASELIYSVALAVKNRLSVEQLAQTITVYPSLSGSIAEAARRLRAVT